MFSNVEGGLPARRPPQESGFNMIWPHQEVVQIPKLIKISENELCAESIFKCILEKDIRRFHLIVVKHHLDVNILCFTANSCPHTKISDPALQNL